MQENNQRAYLIGKIKEYDNASGTIVAEDLKEYMFLDHFSGLAVGDIVKFRPEEKNEIKIAYFVERHGQENVKEFLKQRD